MTDGSARSQPADAPRRLSLLYQLYLVNQAARQLVKASLLGSGMSGEEYALYSYFFANGARTMSQAARDLGMPLTTLATLLQEPIERGDLERRPHPRDRRARLLRLTEAGNQRLRAVIPAFTAGHRRVLAALEEAGVETEPLFEALSQLRGAIDTALEQMHNRGAAEALATS